MARIDGKWRVKNPIWMWDGSNMMCLFITNAFVFFLILLHSFMLDVRWFIMCVGLIFGFLYSYLGFDNVRKLFGIQTMSYFFFFYYVFLNRKYKLCRFKRTSKCVYQPNRFQLYALIDSCWIVQCHRLWQLLLGRAKWSHLDK